MVTEKKQLPLGEELDFAALSRLKKRLPGCRLGPDEGDSSFTLNCPSFVSFWWKRRKLSLESEEKTEGTWSAKKKDFIATKFVVHMTDRGSNLRGKRTPKTL